MIDFHSDGYGRPASPAVNVKIRGSGREVRARMWRDWERYAPTGEAGEDWDRRFTDDWIDAHLDDGDQSFWWEQACTRGWERLQEDYDAHADLYFFGPARVVAEGRSGGWAVLYDREGHRPLFDRAAVAGWDAIALAKWARFVTWAEQARDDVPFQYLDQVYFNVFLPWAERDREARQAAHREEGLSV